MLTSLFSKPIFSLSVAILVNEKILRSSTVLSNDIKSRHFARWSTRKPSKIFTPDQISSGKFDTEEFYKSEYSESSEVKPKTNTKINTEKIHLEENDESRNQQLSSGMDYTVLKENDLTFSKLMTLAGNRKMRRKHDIMMLEGKRLNLDAIQAGLKPKKLFFTQKSMLEELNLPPDLNIPLFKIPYKTISLWSKLETPPGIIGFYSLVDDGDIKTTNAIPVKVICDNVRDPGNMGSIIRVAASVGCTGIVLLKGCTDPWDSKVLRSASGGHFHIPIKTDMLWSQHKEFLDSCDKVCLADSRSDRTPTFRTELPQTLYYDFNYTTSPSIAIVIGGETEGLSNDAFKCAANYDGSRIYIPLSNCVESLNSGCALSVILFEVKRQYLKGKNNFAKSDNLSIGDNCEDEVIRTVRTGG